MLKKLGILMFVIITMLNVLSSAEKYAVLITGDYAAVNIPERALWQTESTEKYPMKEFWYDTYLMWEMLYLNGYEDENIFVLFADGTDYCLDPDNGVNERYSPQWQDFPEGFTITDGAATRTNILSVVDKLKSKMTDDDFLFVWTFDHGNYIGSLDEWHSLLYLLDEDGNPYEMDDIEFAGIFNNSESPIPANKKVYCMQQCYGGGFHDNLTNNLTQKDVFFNSAAHMTPAYRADDRTEDRIYIRYLEKELIQSNSYPHGEFDFHIYSSTMGYTPNPIFTDNYHGILYSDADINNDGCVSVLEAAKWEEFYESSYDRIPIYNEEPLIVDLGIGVHTSIKYPTLINGDYSSYNSYLRGIMAIPVSLTINQASLKLPSNSHTTLFENSTIDIYSGYSLWTQEGATLKLSDGSGLRPATGGSLIFDTGSNLVVEGSASIIGDIQLGDGVNIDILENSSLAFQVSQLTVTAGTTLRLGANAKLIIENGTNFVIQNGSYVMLAEGAQIVVNNRGFLAADGATFNYTGTEGGNWMGINGQTGSTIDLNNVSISGAITGVTADTPAMFKVTNSTFEGCTNGIDLTGVKGLDYTITDNTLTGIEDGRGITITSVDGVFSRNKISRFNIGASFIMSSPVVSKCEFTYNKYHGILVSGHDALPQLINTEHTHAVNELNCLIEKNAYVSGTSVFPSSQIGLIPVGNIYMRDNDIISSINYPGISIAQAAVMNQHIIVDAQYNYWGAEQITDDYFFGHTDYTIDYEPYYTYPSGTMTTDPEIMQSISTESRLLSNALNLEFKDKLTPAIKLYEQIIKKYVDTPEYYVAMARLPYLYDKAGLDNNELIALFDEALKSDKVSHKKFFKGKKVATHIKGKRYDEAIAVAEEMKAEADFEEEIILADINIAIANMLKDPDGKGKSGKQSNVRELISELFNYEDKAESSDITESSIPSQHELYQNYPNPFNPVTSIKFALAKMAEVKLSVYNISGQLVSQLANGTMNAGIHAVDFDGSKLNSGIYYYSLEVDGRAMTRRMVLMK